MSTEPEVEECDEECEALIEQSLASIEAGNFTRCRRDEHGVMWKQKFVNHQPVGEPVAWTRFNEVSGR